MLILASASPRRAEILSNIGLDFRIEVPDVDESTTETLPEKIAIAIARKKAESLDFPDDVIISADTIVVYENEVLGKPKNKADAKAMLTKLSGNSHTVYTGVCLKKGDSIHCFYEATMVQFYPLTEAEIDGYVATGEPMDKAGAYGIQGKGAAFVKRIEGDYLNVVGLPVSRLLREINNI